MENLDIKKESKEIVNKVKFFNKNKIVFKLINIVLGNIVFEYQLKEFLLITKYIEDENDFKEFMAHAISFGLVSEGKFENTNKIVYMSRDYVIKNIKSDTKKGTYKYKYTDAVTSYYKMCYILEIVKQRLNAKSDLEFIVNAFISYSTFNIGKSSHYKLYKELDKRKKLNIRGEEMLADLEYYNNKKLLNFKSSGKVDNKIKSIIEDEIYMQKLELTCSRIVGNKKFWDYNLGKISDNKSYFMFFNQSLIDGYKLQYPGTLDIVKFDTSDSFSNAKIGDYITRAMESIKYHIKEEYKTINMYIYFSDKNKKSKIFNDCVSYKLNRNGVKNLDSKLTARIKETSRREYQIRFVSFTNPEIDFDKYKVSYKIFYKPQRDYPDDYYTLNIYFRNVDFENDLYSKEEQEQKKKDEEIKRKEREVKKFANDPEFLALLMKELENKK